MLKKNITLLKKAIEEFKKDSRITVTETTKEFNESIEDQEDLEVKLCYTIEPNPKPKDWDPYENSQVMVNHEGKLEWFSCGVGSYLYATTVEEIISHVFETLEIK